MKDEFEGFSVSTGGSFGPMSEMSAYAGTEYNYNDYNGQKSFFGINYDYNNDLDYWTLRQRSSELFIRNSYARGIIRRLVTNVINTGLIPESLPQENVLGISQDEAMDFSEKVESRFSIYSKTPKLVDFTGEKTLSQLQIDAFTEALIEGDVLIMLVGSDPQVKIIPGSAVKTPPDKYTDKNIIHGVEFKKGKRVAYHVEREDGTFDRVRAYGKNTGQLRAWLFYANDKRVNEVRGEPLLSLIIQNLKEIDDYRDSAQRKANIGSKFVGFVERTNEKEISSKAITQGAARKTQGYTTLDADGGNRKYNLSEIDNGIFIETLSVGETMKAFNGATDIDLQKFEDTIVSGVAWAYEIPPEILKLSFNSNYSASQSAKEEFKMFLNMVRSLRVGQGLLSPIYKLWILNSHATRQLETPGFMESYHQGDLINFNAWAVVDWSGAIKPSSDIVKTANGYGKLAEMGFITKNRATRETTGMKFTDNLKVIKRENELFAEAMRPIMEFKREFGVTPEEANVQATDDIKEMKAKLEEALSAIDNITEES